MLKKIIQTDDAKTTIIIRLMAGAAFHSEGIQKCLSADESDAGRFVRTGLPNPEFSDPLAG